MVSFIWCTFSSTISHLILISDTQLITFSICKLFSNNYHVKINGGQTFNEKNHTIVFSIVLNRQLRELSSSRPQGRGLRINHLQWQKESADGLQRLPKVLLLSMLFHGESPKSSRVSWSWRIVHGESAKQVSRLNESLRRSLDFGEKQFPIFEVIN